MSYTVVCIPVNVVRTIGRRPNLSDHGPINKLTIAGIILSNKERAIRILATYGCTSVSMRLTIVNTNKRNR